MWRCASRGQLTVSEIEKLGADTKMYRGVGRMFLAESKDATTARINSEIAANEDAIKSLVKEKEYLEKSYKESEESLRELLRNR